MSYLELVAGDVDEYVDLAVRLASHGTVRERVVQELCSRAEVLYSDGESVREWSHFLSRITESIR
jgi:predicted O-linked N-acetylglucosamine transferase (SPINDLY family)